MSKTKTLTWKTIQVPLKDLHEWDKNPVEISERDAKELAKSLGKFDHVIPYVAAAPPNGKSGLPLLDGHQRKMVEIQMNNVPMSTLVDVRVPSRKLTEKEREEIVIRLRKNTGEFDFDKLANFFDVPDLLEWGFTEKELQLGGFEFEDTTQDAEPQINKADELLEKWKVKHGQLWIIDKHRLLCGDTTNPKDVEKIMGVDVADMTFIDPPFNALKSWNKDEANSETRLDPSKWFENDNMEWEDYWLFIEKLLSSLQGHSVYVCCDFRIYDGLKPRVVDAGYKVKHCIVWKKNVWGLGKRYRFQHEFIIYACKGNAPFYGDRSQSDVWEIDIIKTTDHNTPKPVGLAIKAIENSSKDGAIVFDGCCGYGTTLVACHNTNRRGFGIELSPAYVAVTLERLSKIGLMPVLSDL